MLSCIFKRSSCEIKIKNLMESTKLSAIRAMEMLLVSGTERDMYLNMLG